MSICTIPAARKPALDNRWISQHERHVNESKEAEPDVLLIGDSIIQQMLYHKFWDVVISPLHPLNLGVGGDSTQNVLWRIENGAMESLKPKVIVVHAGTNNTDNTAEEVSEGIVEIVKKLREKFKDSYIIFWGLLPRGEWPNKVCDKNKLTNELVTAKISSMPLTEIICTGEILRQNDKGRISTQDLFDFLHPTEAGFYKIFTPVVNRIREILSNK